MDIMANGKSVVTHHYTILVGGIARKIGITVNLYEVACELAEKACQNKSRASTAVKGAIVVENNGLVQA